MTTLIAAVDPAGGAAIGEVIGATAGAMVATTLLFALGFGHRSGRTQLLERWSGFAARVAGLPKWVALPSAIGTGSLIVALLGMYWDISLHIDQGRDPGPLANPAHYLILFGLFGIFAAGFLAMAIPKEKPVPDRDPALRRLGRAARRAADGRGRRLRADRLPARRHVAPAVRAGRDALGPDPPDADRRRLDLADRPGDPARRGHALAPRRPGARRAAAAARRSPAAS